MFALYCSARNVAYFQNYTTRHKYAASEHFFGFHSHMILYLLVYFLSQLSCASAFRLKREIFTFLRFRNCNRLTTFMQHYLSIQFQSSFRYFITAKARFDLKIWYFVIIHAYSTVFDKSR